MRVGFVGLGLMGGPMAMNVRRSGFALTVYNRTPEKSREVVAAGARWADTPQEVGAASDVVITMVSDDAALDEVLFGSDGVAKGLARGGIVLDMSTTSPAAMLTLGEKLAERGISLVDSPVFGSTEPAESGQLWAVVGADDRDLETVRPLLETMCGSVFHMGGVGAGSVMKVSGNLIVTGMLALLGEGLTLAQAGGVRPAQMLEVLAAIDFSSPLYAGKGAQVVADDFAPRFPLRHALKDTRLALSVASLNHLDLRVISAVSASFAVAEESGYGSEDCIAVIKSMKSDEKNL